MRGQVLKDSGLHFDFVIKSGTKLYEFVVCIYL